MKRAIVTVGNDLLQRKVLLLPTVHDIFCGYVNEMTQGLKIKMVVFSAWILSNLTVALGKHITYTCGIYTHVWYYYPVQILYLRYLMHCGRFETC